MTDSNDLDFLLALQAQLKQRKNMSAETSYAASLFEKGDNAILKKIAEEAGEVIMATKDGDDHEIIYEVADLLFHCMVLLEAKDISIQQVVNELARRSGVSGLEEKANRQK